MEQFPALGNRKIINVSIAILKWRRPSFIAFPAWMQYP